MQQFCFKKEHKITTNYQYKQIFAVAKKFFGIGFVVYFVKNTTSTARIGVIISKKTQKKAVKRNAFKRIVRNCFRTNKHLLQGKDLVVIATKAVNNLSSQDLHQNLCFAWEKLHVR